MDVKLRNKAKKILYDKLKYQGMQYVIFTEEEEENSSNAIIETIVDAMIEFGGKKK